MAEGLIALSHPMSLFLPLHGRADTVAGVKELERELLCHRFPASLPRETDQPAPGERKPALRPDLDRDLVGGAANAAGLDLELWRRVPDRQVEDLEGLLLGLSGGACQGVVDDALGDRALARPHEDVHELRHRVRVVDGVGRDTTLVRTVAAGHLSALARCAGFFALRAVAGPSLLAVANA